MRSRIIKILFPAQFRDFPYRRLVLNILRGIHILCFAIILGGIFFQQETMIFSGWVAGVILSGLCMLSIQLYSSFIALFEIQTMAILIKVVLLGFIPELSHQGQVGLLMTIIIFSSITSHASRRFRHTSIASKAFLQTYGFSRSKVSR